MRFFQVDCELDKTARTLYDELANAVQSRVRLIVREAGDNNFSESATDRPVAAC